MNENQDLIKYIPQNLQNPVITSLLKNIFNQFLTRDNSIPLYGYIGQKPINDYIIKIPQSNVERDINTIIPVLSFNVGAEKFIFTIQDLVKKAEVLGIESNNWKFLYSQGNNYIPPINLDKFANFFNYYWIAKAIPTTPILSWNPELLPEYYIISPPLPSDAQKLNVVTASTSNTVLTGTGFMKLSFKLHFNSETVFSIEPIGSLGEYTSIQSDLYDLGTSRDTYIEYLVTGPRGTFKLLQFNIIRDDIFDQNGNNIGLESFEIGDEFLLDVTFLIRNYTLTFTGGSGVKGKITKVKVLNEYQIIDGVQLQLGDRVLIKNNSINDDGIYIVSPGIWERAIDFNSETAAAGARIFVKNGIINGSKLFQSIQGSGGFGWEVQPETQSNTNNWQEGNYWVSSEELSKLNLTRADAIQAVRPIIEYHADIQLSSYVKNGIPSDSGTKYEQVKTEFNELPLFDLFRYNGIHSGEVSSIFFYEEDFEAELDLKLQKRIKRGVSADFSFNHGLYSSGQLLFMKRNGELKTIWHPGYIEPTIVNVSYTGIGNGIAQNWTAIGLTEQQIWTLTAETSNSFKIVGSKMLIVPNLLVGELYNNNEFSVLIQEGTIPFNIGDTFIVRIGNLESTRYVYRDNEKIFNLYGGPNTDIDKKGAWQIPRLFYNNPYNESQSSILEGTLYSHFREILSNQVTNTVDNAFGGNIKLWSEAQSLLASLLMQRDLTPISMIDNAERQYRTALNIIRDSYQDKITQFLSNFGAIQTSEDIEVLRLYLEDIRKYDNDVRNVIHDSTAAVLGFPATLPQLGIAELVKPEIKFNIILGKTLLLHHDGHWSPLFEDTFEFRNAILGTGTILRSNGTYTKVIRSFNTIPSDPYKGELWIDETGILYCFNVLSDDKTPTSPTVGDFWYKREIDELYIWNITGWELYSNKQAPWVIINLADILNSLFLHIEMKLFDGINPNARKFNFTSLLENNKFNSLLKDELFLFAGMNNYSPLASDYDLSDAFTWNYSRANLNSLPPLNTSIVPARWFNLLKAHQRTITSIIPTERPNIEPWKLFGIDNYNTWWNGLSSNNQIRYTPYMQLDELGNNRTIVKVVKTISEITTLSGLQSIDGISLSSGDVILLQNEISPENNGIWVVYSGTWVRSTIPLIQGLYVIVTSGISNKDTIYVLSETVVLHQSVLFKQARVFTDELWADIKTLHPMLRLSVNTRTDALLPPYVNSSYTASNEALTIIIPSGASLEYQFGESSLVETIWRSSLEYKYSLTRTLFRFDPLAFLGFCWGINWIKVDNILYDGFDMNMPGHKRFRLHGELIETIQRTPLEITNGTSMFDLTYTAYDNERKQNFTISQNGITIGYIQEGIEQNINGRIFTIKDEGIPFRIGDKFEVKDVINFIPSKTYIFMGFGQIFTQALRETGINTSISYAISAYREWDVNTGYRVGGLVRTENLQVRTENSLLSQSAYDLIIKRNSIARSEWIQALRISVIQFGTKIKKDNGYIPINKGEDWIFKIEGYNPQYLKINYYNLSANNSIDFYALSEQKTNITWIHPLTKLEIINSVLPITITGIQSIINFLFGYSLYLEEQGWEFNQNANIDAETGRIRNFQLEIEKFINTCYSGIELNQGCVINPFIDKAWFNQRTGLLSEFIDTSLFDITVHPGVFDALGIRYKKEDLNVLRTNEQSSFGAAGPMFSAHIELDEFEHIFIWKNFAEPSTNSGRLYHPFSGSRVVTFKLDARQQGTNVLRPELGGHFIRKNEVLQNLQASTDTIQNFYDVNHIFENENTTKQALALLGYNSKSYFDDLGISRKTQFNFWRGLIQSKGTNLSIDAFLNNIWFNDAKIDEYWAYKIAEYGDARECSSPELKLSVRDVVSQFTQLQFNNSSLAPDFSTVNRFDEDRWFSIDDNDRDTSFNAEIVGVFELSTPEIGKIYELPFIADKLVGTGFNQINTNTIEAISAPIVIQGYGVARSYFNPMKLFNYINNELITEIPLWHPAIGEHTPTALECINIISDLNPAKINYSTRIVNNDLYDPLRPWGENEIGRIWFNTSELEYLPYYDVTVFPSLSERLSRWGTIADFSSIDIYEWVKSTVPPLEYNKLALSSTNSDFNQITKGAGEVANEQLYVRDRNWLARPIVWSYSPVPIDIDWEGMPPFVGGSFNTKLYFDNIGTVSLEFGTFSDFGISAGMHIGAWNSGKPLSEYIIENKFTRVISGAGNSSSIISVEVKSIGSSALSGDLLFTSEPTEILERSNADGSSLSIWDITASLNIIELSTGREEVVKITSAIGTATSGTLHGGSITLNTNQLISIIAPTFELELVITVFTGGTYPADTLRNEIVSVLANNISIRNAVQITAIIPNPGTVISPLSNDPLDPEIVPGSLNDGWRVWSIPTQDELDNDGYYPNSSWKPFLGDFILINANLKQIQDAVQDATSPLMLNNKIVVNRFTSTWTNWSILQKTVLSKVQTQLGDISFTYTENIDTLRTSVYVNGITKLKAGFTISGKNINVNNIPIGSKVTVIIRYREPTVIELEFNPSIEDNLLFQQQFKKDFEYTISLVRDTEGTFTSPIYYFWVKNKTTAAIGKKLSIQAITQELRRGPTNFLTFQTPPSGLLGNGTISEPYYYDAITISGLSYIVTKDNTFKLRFTRNFTLRDNPEELNLKNIHVEWMLLREGQKTKIPELLWQKLTDSIAGMDIAGNKVPANRRILYDERHGTRTQFGFNSEQILAPSEILKTSIIFSILNTKIKYFGTKTIDYISFLNLNESKLWFKDEIIARKTMTDIWNKAKVAQINEIFFNILHDLLAHNYELDSIFKTSRLSVYSIKIIEAPITE